MQKILSFFREVKEIFHQITWPTKDTLIQSTVVVISVSVILSLILGGFDYLFVNTIGVIARSKNKLLSPPQTQEVPEAFPTFTTSTPSATTIPTIKLKN